MADERPEWGIIMPFTVVKSHGGPYDDEPFTAGFSAGRLYAADREYLTGGDHIVYAHLLPQLDLIAMHHGLAIEASTIEDPAWISVRFSEPDGGVPG